MKIKNVFLVFMVVAFAANPALAASGGSNISSLFNTILSEMTTVGAVILTIAILWAAYKIMFLGNTLREVAPFLLGGVIAGSAAWMAGLLVS